MARLFLKAFATHCLPSESPSRHRIALNLDNIANPVSHIALAITQNSVRPSTLRSLFSRIVMPHLVRAGGQLLKKRNLSAETWFRTFPCLVIFSLYARKFMQRYLDIAVTNIHCAKLVVLSEGLACSDAAIL